MVIKSKETRMVTYTYRYSSGYLIPNLSWRDWKVHVHNLDSWNKGYGSSCTYSQQQILMQKVGMDHEIRTLQWNWWLHFHIVHFLISRLTWSNPGHTQIIFKACLTWMIHKKHDPYDPTQFQHWYQLSLKLSNKAVINFL